MSEALEDRIAAMDIDIEALEAARASLAQEWADENCPYKVGDRAAAKGYSFNGKPCEIKQVFAIHSCYGRLLWKVSALLVKKNGALGVNTVRWDQRQDDAR